MNYCFAQFILAARGNDFEGWMDILILVIIAAVYGLGAIIKTKRKKPQEQVEEELSRKPARKPATGGRGVLEQFVNELRGLAESAQGRESRPIGQPARQKIARPQPAVRKYAAEAKNPGLFQQGTLPAKPKLTLPNTQVEPESEKLPDFTSKSVESLADRHRPVEVVEPEYLSEVLADFTHPDELRMAILHYEILGRPLSLREPSGQIIGL